MTFRLTYAVNNDEIYTVELKSKCTDFLSANETAIDYMLAQHGVDTVLNIIGFSILKIGESYEN